MKKFLLTLFVVLMSVALIACSKKADEDEGTSSGRFLGKNDKEVETTATPEPTPVPTEVPTPEPTEVPAPEPEVPDVKIEDTADIDDVTIVDIGGEPVEPSDYFYVDLTSDYLMGHWIVDRDALFEYVIQLAYIEADGAATEEEIRDYCYENKEELDEQLADDYNVTLDFYFDECVLFNGRDESASCDYMITDEGLTLYDPETGESYDLTYNPFNAHLTLYIDTYDVVMEFYKEGEEFIVAPDYTDPDFGIDIDLPEMPEITGSPVGSIAEVAGTWTIDFEAVFDMYLTTMLEEYKNYLSEEELKDLIAESGDMYDEISEEFGSMVLYIAETGAYLAAEDETMMIDVIPSSRGVILHSYDYPDEDIELLYSSEDGKLYIAEDGLMLAFIRQ